MTDFTFTDPSGKDHVVSGPEGATQEQAFQILQQHLASQSGGAPGGAQQSSGLGDLWQKALSHLPPEVQKQAASLMPSWGHNDASYSPYKPAQPGNMPNDAINPVGTDAQLTAAAGGAAGVARALAPKISRLQPGAAAPPDQVPGIPKVDMSQMPTQQSFGAQMARNVGQAPMARPAAPAIPSNPITNAPPLPGTTSQQASLLRDAVHSGSGMVGHALGLGPLGHIAGRGITRMLGM